jgi:hypothetical protein
MGASAGDWSAIRPPSRYIEVRQAGVYGIYIGNDDTGKIHFIARPPVGASQLRAAFRRWTSTMKRAV